LFAQLGVPDIPFSLSLLISQLLGFNLLRSAFTSIGLKHLLRLLLSYSIFVLLLPLSGQLLLFCSFGLHGLSEILFLFFLLADYLKMLFRVRSISELSFLVILVIDLSVILVLAASSSVLALHSSLFKIAFSLGHEATVFPVEGILEFQETCIVLSANLHAHEG
jgi:hypothetical protein